MSREKTEKLVQFSPELLALPERWQIIVMEYMKNGMIASDAYKKGYPKASKATCETNGPALLRNTQVKAAVRAELDMILGEDKLIIERLIFSNLKQVMSAEMGDYIDDDAVIDVEAVRTINPSAVLSVEKEEQQTETGFRSRVKITLDSRAKAREHGLKVLGLLKDDENKTFNIYLPPGFNDV